MNVLIHIPSDLHNLVAQFIGNMELLWQVRISFGFIDSYLSVTDFLLIEIINGLLVI